jgi:murein DD-endopeptidase MepM/ murein hydrolase activator NlpD
MPVFPFERLDQQRLYHHAPRCFAAIRDGGERKHAGVDLYASVGTMIRSCEAGEITAGPYPFYAGTFALEVRHQDGRVVRYGEILSAIGALKVGDHVAEGQPIARVGRLQGLPVAMLHFEMFRGTLKGPLTDLGRPPFLRRADLVDPTEYLDACINAS